MATAFKWGAYNTADTLTWTSAGTGLNSLANAGYALSSEVDNSTLLHQFGDVTIAFSAAVTSLGTPAFISIYLIPNIDGNYTASTYGAVGATYLAATVQAVSAAASVQYLQARGLVLTPNKFKLMIQNSLGVSFAATTTVSLYRYSEQGV